MYLTIDLEPCSYDTDIMFIHVLRNWTFNKREYVAEISVFTAPKYQALAMKNALKEVDPQEYRHGNVVSLKLIQDSGTAIAQCDET